MHLYFVRHGESEANVARQFSNHNDGIHPLTAKGKEQAQTVAELLRPVKFTEIYASPMLRARQTAEIVGAPHGLDIQIVPALREHDAGDLEGRADEAAWRDFQTLFETWIVKRDLDARIPNGESFNDLKARFGPFLDGLVQKHADTNASILIVAHAGIFHAMLPALLSNVGYEFGATHILGNTGIIVVEVQEGMLLCREWAGVRFSSTGEPEE